MGMALSMEIMEVRVCREESTVPTLAYRNPNLAEQSTPPTTPHPVYPHTLT